MTTRRDFLVRIAGLTAAVALPEAILRDPYHPLPLRRRGRPIRVRGRVTAGGRAVAGARVSDGRTVVRVNAEGHFDFVSSSTQRYVTLCPPAGHALPTNPTGTMRLYRALDFANQEIAVEFELQQRMDNDDRHAMLVLADPQTQNAFEMQRLHDETVPDVMRTREALGERPVFGVACGDIMYDHLELYPEYERAVARMGLPFAQVVGNHDLDFDARTTEGSSATFQRHFGPAHYSFDIGAVHYMVLNDVFWYGAGYLGYLTEEQLEWVRNDLAFVERGRTVVVLLHIPVLSTQYERLGRREPAIATSVTNRQALTRLLEPYRVHVIAGHTHESEHRMDGNLHEHVAGATCGAWWSGDICFEGTPNGYAVYEMQGERATWRYKSTGRDATHQMRIYAPGSDPSAPRDLVVNVWDWDPSWTLRFYENGEPRGTLARRRGLDPRSVVEHTGDQLPKRREWVEPLVTDHLFRATTTPGAREWRVEARDGFDRVYNEVLLAR